MGDLTSIGTWLADNHFGEITRTRTIAGGCINETSLLTLEDGQTLFLKQHGDPPPDFFTAEAKSLDALREACRLNVPTVIHADENFLILEDLGSASPTSRFGSILGEELAMLHNKVEPEFGFNINNYCGTTMQENPRVADGYEFYARHRLLPLALRAEGNGLLATQDRQKIESIANKLSNWIPQQPAVLLHGDLWSGNVHCDKMGQPALIDPACYWGWAEAELAMTLLFGGFNSDFYSAYESATDISVDWRDRAALYNLYHLLNHLLLFGDAYLGQVRSVIARYS